MLTFFVLAAVMVIGALGVITLKQPVHASLSLVGTLLTLAVTYVTLEAHFLATIQVIVYAGAIMVLFLFVIMLLNIGDDNQQLAFPWMRPAAYVVGLLAAAGLVFSVLSNPSQLPDMAVVNAALQGGGAGSVADALFSEFVLAFQLVGVLLLTGIIGAVSLVQRRAEEDAALEPARAVESRTPSLVAAGSGGGSATVLDRSEPSRETPDESLEDIIGDATEKESVSEKDDEKLSEVELARDKAEQTPSDDIEDDAVGKNVSSYVREDDSDEATGVGGAATSEKSDVAQTDEARYSSNPDDLKRINGIGPKLEKLLNKNGIYTFEQIANLSPQGVKDLDEQLETFRGRIERDDWLTQARELANEQGGNHGSN